MMYLIEVSIVWIIALAIYWMMYRHTTFFQWNRRYLLLSLILGLVIPIIAENIPSFTAHSPVRTFIYDLATVEISGQPTPSPTEDPISPLWMIYMIGTLIAASRLLYGLYKIATLYIHARHESWQGYTLVITDKEILPFSFLKYVFLGSQEEVSEMKSIILRHERIHMDQGHTWDVLFVAVLQVIFWVNPILILYNRELKNLHEYIADNEVAQTYEKSRYSQLLLERVLSGKQVILTNQFYSSNIKNRIQMLYKKHSSNRMKWLYILAFPVAIMTTMSFATAKKEYVKLSEIDGTRYTLSRDTIIPTPPMPPSPPKKTSIPAPPPAPPAPPAPPSRMNSNGVYVRPDEMPRFPGCEDVSTRRVEKEKCAQQKMLNFIYENLTYPEDARKAKIEGMVVVRFIVNTDGSIGYDRILRNPHPSLGEEVLRVLRLFPKWIPGKDRGKIVKVAYTLPVRFKMDNTQKAKK